MDTQALDLEAIIDYVEGKSVLVIGNADLPEPSCADYDLVIRINHGIKGKGVCNLWVDSTRYEHRDPFTIEEHKKAEYIINLDGRYSAMVRGRGLPPWRIGQTHFLDSSMYKEMVFRTYSYLTAGLATICFLLYYTRPLSIDLCCFDFGKTKNKYTGGSMYSIHDKNKEENLINQWVASKPYLSFVSYKAP